jgi:uncharacterized repeat protein (TIGR02543 family)
MLAMPYVMNHGESVYSRGTKRTFAVALAIVAVALMMAACLAILPELSNDSSATDPAVGSTVTHDVTTGGNTVKMTFEVTKVISATEYGVQVGDGDYSSISVLYEDALAIPSSFTEGGYTYDVVAIGDSAFSGCNMSAVTIPNSVTQIGKNAFWECLTITTISIPESVTSIGEWAFAGCTVLASVSIPEGVTSIDGNAFYGCTSLTAVTIPASVTSIGANSTQTIGAIFVGCSKLTSITVTAGNSSFSSVDGVLYDHDKTMLVEYPAAKDDTSFTLPGTVTTVVGGAFEWATKLTSIDLSSATTFGDSAFYGCNGVKTLYFHTSTGITATTGHVFNLAGPSSSSVECTVWYNPTTLTSDFLKDCCGTETIFIYSAMIALTYSDTVGGTSITDYVVPDTNVTLRGADTFAVPNGYSAFSSWTIGGGIYAAGASYSLGSSPVSIDAVWAGNAYTVTFDANGGSGTMSSESFVYGTAKELTANSFTRSGYTFAGWNAASDGTGTAYADKASVSDLSAISGANVKLYAQWKAVPAADNTMLYVGIGAVAAIVLAGAAFFLLRRR